MTHPTFPVEQIHLFWVTLPSDITHVFLKACFISKSQQQPATQCHPGLLLRQYSTKNSITQQSGQMPIYWDGLLITWNATKPHYLTITLVVVMVLLVMDLEWQLKNCTEQISVFGNSHWGKKWFRVWTKILLEWVRQITITTSPLFIWSLIFFSSFLLFLSFDLLKPRGKVLQLKSWSRNNHILKSEVLQQKSKLWFVKH